MISNSSQKLSLSIAIKILAGFEGHYQNIKSASIEAKRCFEEKEWEKIIISIYKKKISLIAVYHISDI